MKAYAARRRRHCILLYYNTCAFYMYIYTINCKAVHTKRTCQKDIIIIIVQRAGRYTRI